MIIRGSYKRIIVSIIVGIISFLWLSPYLWMVLVSFRIPSEALSHTFPTRFTFDNIKSGLLRTQTLTVFGNTLIVAGCATCLAMLLGVLAGYGFSRYTFRGKQTILNSLIVLRSFPVIVVALAFLIIIAKIGLYDTFLALILINSALALPEVIWNMRSIFDGLPIEIEEAALIDGCTPLNALFKIVLPISLPGIAATGAFIFLICWNEFLLASLFISSTSKKLITMAIYENIEQFGMNTVDLMATSVLATLPLCFLFIVVQRYIVSGLHGWVEEV